MLYLGADHNGYKLKEEVKRFLDKRKIAYADCGALSLQKDDDYPKYAFAVGERVRKNKDHRGILFCGSGEGVAIAANKVKGVRAAYVASLENAKLARQHNDANVLCLSAWNSAPAKAKQLINTFLSTKFSTATRHQRRVRQINRYA